MANKPTKSSTPPKPIKVSDNTMRFNLEDYLIRAVEKQTSPDLYSNYVHVVVTEYEVMLDFYRASRIPGKVDIELVHLQKLFLPLSVGKSLNNALERTIANYEKSTGVEIVNLDVSEEGE